MDRFIDTIEWIAAGFVGIVAANIFHRGSVAQYVQLFDPGFRSTSGACCWAF